MPSLLRALPNLGLRPSHGATQSRRGNSHGRLPGRVCTVNGVIVAYCFGDSGSGEIVVLAVLPEYEGRRIGKALLSSVMGELWKLGHKRLFLGCSSNSAHRSYGFYRHLGWRPTGQLDDNEDEVLISNISE
jgi:GNAT superfamily N-acetyltransferase